MAEQKLKLNMKLLNFITKRIVEKFTVTKIILFGSHAYGKPRKDSDIDLFIIMKTKERPSERRIMISRLFRDREMPMDFIVRTPEEIKRRLDMGDFFIKKILEKGYILYEKKIS
jgi:predicted nucleotidyltransferase